MKKFIETLKNCWKIEDLRQRILITILFVAIYRFGSFVVLPGINPAMLEKLQNQTSGGLMSLLDMFSGGAFSHASIFALGIMPYISASIVMQLLAVAVPYFQKMQREGESGRKKINWYTRVLTVFILVFQAPSYLMNLKAQAYGALAPGLDWGSFILTATIILAAGSMFVLWLGERITDKGVGNGVSLIIMIGIIARLPQAFIQETSSRFTAITNGGLVMFIIELLILYLVVCAALLLTQGTRKVPVQYAKRIVGNKQYGGARQYIPLKLFAANVMPIIFASSVMMAPSIIASLFIGNNDAPGWVTQMEDVFNYQKMTSMPGGWEFPWGLIIYLFLIVVFSFFYANIQINPQRIAENFQNSGTYITGLRPGNETEAYIGKIVNRVTFLGAAALLVICCLPIALSLSGAVPQSLALGGSGLIIVVGVAIEVWNQLDGILAGKSFQDSVRI